MWEYWNSYVYLYGVGGLLFFTALFLGLKKKVLNLHKKRDQKLLFGFLFAFVFYAGLHAWWNLKAIEALP